MLFLRFKCGPLNQTSYAKIYLRTYIVHSVERVKIKPVPIGIEQLPEIEEQIKFEIYDYSLIEIEKIKELEKRLKVDKSISRVTREYEFDFD